MVGMDVNTHVRAIWRHRWLILAGAMVLGGAVLGLRLAQPPTYTTSAALYLVPGSETSDSDITRLTDVYSQLGDNSLVLTSTVDTLDDPAIDVTAVRSATGVALESDGLLRVQATADDAARSAGLTNAYAQALSQAVMGDQARARTLLQQPIEAQLADVGQEIDQASPQDAGYDGLLERRRDLQASRASILAQSVPRLDVLTLTEASSADRTPRPFRDALLAFLVGLILLAELIVVRAVRQGRLDGIGVTETLEQVSGLPALRVGRSERTGDQRAAVLSLVFADERAPGTPVVLKLLPLNPTPASRSAWVLLADAAVRAGHRAVVVDVDGSQHGLPPGAPPVVPLPLSTALQPVGGKGTHSGDVVLATLASWDAPELLNLTALTGSTALVVDIREVRKTILEEALRVLRLAGTPADLLVLVEGKRKRWSLRGRTGTSQAPSAVRA